MKEIKWDVILLSAENIIYYNIEHNSIEHNSIERNSIEYNDTNIFTRIKTTTTASGYIVNKSFMQKLHDNFKESCDIIDKELTEHLKTSTEKLNYCSAIDQHWHNLQMNNIFLLTKPIAGIQNTTYFSDNNCSIDHQRNYIISL